MRTEQQQRAVRERVARTRSRARTVASAVVPCRMADVASACRRTTRASQQPLSLAEEQAAVALSVLEHRDVADALRLSLQDSWNSDEEKSGAEKDDEAESSSSEEEEEKQAAAGSGTSRPALMGAAPDATPGARNG